MTSTLGPLTVTITRVSFDPSEVWEGSLPLSAYESANTETVRCRSWADAVRALRDNGCTEWSGDTRGPDHGWFASPDGSVTVDYSTGVQEETSARISGRGAFRAWVELTRGTADANMYRRSPDPVLGGMIADSWDGGDPYGSAMGALGSIADVLYAAGEDIPSGWGFRPSPLASDSVEDLTESDDLTTSDLAQDYLAGRIDADALRGAGNILSRYLDLLPEDRKY